jgi:hypothetical protein
MRRAIARHVVKRQELDKRRPAAVALTMRFTAA